MTTDPPIYVHGLRAENFKRLELVELRFDGPGLDLVTGDNGEGKSSLLDSIVAALAGKDAFPEVPVRAGADKATLVVDLGERLVRRVIKPDGAQTLVVEDKATGGKLPKPQGILDALCGPLAFDPLAFAAMEPKKQAETLRKLVGLDTSALDAERARVYEERTAVNREAKALRAQAEGMQVPAAPAEVGEEIDLAAVAAKKADVERVRAKNDNLRAIAKSFRATVERKEREALEAVAAVRRAEEALERARRAAAEAEQARKEAVAEAEQSEANAAALVDPDASAIDAEIARAKEHNARVRTAQQAKAAHERALAERRRAEQAAKAKEDASAALSKRLDAIDAEKGAALAAVKFPIPGLSVDGDAVTLSAIPLSQVSSAQRLRACLSIFAALSPRLRFVPVHEGNDLDRKSLRIVAEWARENGMQVLMERVAGDAPTGIVVEAGRVVADLRERIPAPPVAHAGDDGFQDELPL